jgi:hypothetical protein
MKTKLLSILLLSSVLFKSIDAMEKEGFNYKGSELIEALYKARDNKVIEEIKNNINYAYGKIINNNPINLNTKVSEEDEIFLYSNIITPSLRFRLLSEKKFKGFYEVLFDVTNTQYVSDVLGRLNKNLSQYQKENNLI